MRLIRLSFLVMILSLFGIAHDMTGSIADAKVISNIAAISWDEGAARKTIVSNRIDTPVAIDPALTLAAFRVDSSGQSVSIVQPMCQGNGGVIPVSVVDGFAGKLGSGARIAPTQQVHSGEPLIVQVSYAPGNLDPDRIDMITDTLITRGGDREVLTIGETGVDTGVFVGYIQTRAGPPALEQGDCILTVQSGDKILVQSLPTGSQIALNSAEVDVLIDPFGIVFDSEDGLPVNGVRVTIVNADTGEIAEVFGDDGRTRYPSTVVTGQASVDALGNIYPSPTGEYRFPLLRAGRYRLRLEPPAPYTAPSKATPAMVSGLTRPDGLPLAIVDGSYGGVIILSDPAPVRVDIPVDSPTVLVSVSKSASQAQAIPGELILYTVTVRNLDSLRAKRNVAVADLMPTAMRLRADTIRIDGKADASAIGISSDARTLNISLGTLAPGATRTIRYALEVRPDAPEGVAVNRAEVMDALGNRSVADVAVRIQRETIASRLTITGRLIDGDCSVNPKTARGIAGARVMLEDGSYAITDPDGRYHFDGILPGTHVVQVDPATLAGGKAIDCTRSTRSAGNALSRFVEGQGGALLRADFFVTGRVSAPASPTASTAKSSPGIASDPVAAGAERDWFADGKADIAWLFPEIDHNPRAPVVRVAIRHLTGQSVQLFANGAPVDPIAFDGARASPDGRFTVSLWRGIPLLGAQDTLLKAQVRNADGSIAQTLERTVHMAATPARAIFLPERSRLIADGSTRPVIAVRIVDRVGRPVHHGLVGDVQLSAPYEAASEADALQTRILAGLERARPTWHVMGDDGVALIELAPTSVSGAVTLTLPFRDGESAREQRIDTWLEPGMRDWTVVGFAAGSLGFQTLDGHLESLNANGDRLKADGRIALYAKGQIKGKWLLTMAYDSDRKRDASRFGGTIDPDTYYTVYADRSERRFDAASVRKLYLRLERKQFYAMFGDYQTGFTETELGRYVRAANGVKTEYRGKQIAASAFATDSSNRHKREELQGTGLSGPYALSTRDILANSETVTIEVRDRLRSDSIVERKTLTRLIDYDMDYMAGTLRLREPLLSRSDTLNPQFLVVDYEVNQARSNAVNAGVRASWTSAGGAVRIGTTALRDADDGRTTSVIAGDVRVLIDTTTEVRGEIAVSRSAGTTDSAWRVEATHHGSVADIVAYARQQGEGFGVAQQNAAERGRRKIGADVRVRITDPLTATLGIWQDESLTDAARRRAGKGLIEYRNGRSTYRAGLSVAEDQLTDGSIARSSIAQIGATQRLLKQKLELDAQAEFAIGQAASVDFPARHQLSARYAVTPAVQLVGIYEIAQGDVVDARTARLGFDVKPWAGARMTSSLGRQHISEYGSRAFAAYGLAQSLPMGKHLSFDFTLDGNRTLGGINPATVLNPDHPVASGGFLSQDIITEDFTAVTVGATWRANRWSATGRAEYRAGQLGDRSGVTLGLIRQVGEGSTLGGGFTWNQAARNNGPSTQTAGLALSFAHRPVTSDWSWLEKLELRSDRVRDAVLGETGPIGSAPLTVSGNVTSRRVVNSLSANFAPYGRDADGLYQRSELSLFWGSRYMFDRFDSADIRGWSNLIGVDARIGVGPVAELGISGSIRGTVQKGSFSYAIGPNVGVRAVRNGLLTLGWNAIGFEDRDFAALRQLRSGPYVSFQLKFDQSSFPFLGLSR